MTLVICNFWAMAYNGVAEGAFFMNRNMSEHHHLDKDGDAPLLLPPGHTKHHRKLAVEEFLDRLGIPHLKEEVQTELPFKPAAAPAVTHRGWLYGLVGVILGIGIATTWIKCMTISSGATYSMSSFIAQYDWDGFRRVMPALKAIP
jgi:hypothetical protein